MIAPAFMDLGADVVELAAWLPPAVPASTAPVREVSFQRNGWLPDQDDCLRALFGQDTHVDDIAAAIGRTRNAVRSRIDQLGLRRNSARPWSEWEDADLIERYGSATTAQLALELGRSVPSVYARANLLSLSEAAAPDYDGWEDAQIRAGYAAGVPVGQIATLIGRPLLGVRSRASALGVRHPSQPASWTDAEADRALALAHEGKRYLAIIEALVDEGFPRRSKNGFGQRLRILGYGRGWGRRWTPEEDEMLRRAYADGASLTPVRQRLGRSACSIRWRCGELGLQGTHKNKAGWRTGPDWTDADIALLKAEFGKTKSPALATKLGRTKAAMFCRANLLGLVHGYIRPFTAEDDHAIAVAWRHGISQTDVALALGRDVAVISKRAIRLGHRFSAPDRPRPPRTARAGRQAVSLAAILALEPMGVSA